MRRKRGALTPLESALVAYAYKQNFYGWSFIKEHQKIPATTVYRSLMRLEKNGYLSSKLQPSNNRLPSKYIYTLTPKGKKHLIDGKLVPTQNRWYGGSFTTRPGANNLSTMRR